MNILDLKRSLLPMRGLHWGDGSGDRGGNSDGTGGEGAGGNENDPMAPQMSMEPTTMPNMSVDPSLPGLINMSEVAQMAQMLGVPLSEMAQVAANPVSLANTPAAVTGTNISYADLQNLSDLGMGAIGVNATQNVDNALASQNVHGFLNQNIPAAASLVNPAFGAAIASVNQLQGVVTGQVSLGQAAVNTALSQVAQQLGLPVGVVTAAINGNIGQAVSASTAGAIQSAMTQAIASATGLPANVVSFGLNVTDTTKSISPGITNTVNSALGITPDRQTNMASIAANIDHAISGATGFGASAPSSSTPSSSLPDWANWGGSAGSIGATPIQPNDAAIKYMEDLQGLTSNKFSNGGPNEDLLKLLRS